MEYNILSTGSQGNAVVIGAHILIDCGVPFSKLKPVYKKLKIVLLTHIHTDHFKRATIQTLSNMRPTLRFACGEWLVPDLLACGVDKKQIDVLEFGKWYDYTAFQIAAVRLTHNVPNLGYRVYLNGERLFYATDTNNLDGIHAKDYDLYMVEANYTDEEMKERIKEKRERGEYPYEYEVMQNHLSKRKCDNFIYENIGGKGAYVYMHQHQD